MGVSLKLTADNASLTRLFPPPHLLLALMKETETGSVPKKKFPYAFQSWYNRAVIAYSDHNIYVPP